DEAQAAPDALEEGAEALSDDEGDRPERPEPSDSDAPEALGAAEDDDLLDPSQLLEYARREDEDEDETSDERDGPDDDDHDDHDSDDDDHDDDDSDDDDHDDDDS